MEFVQKLRAAKKPCHLTPLGPSTLAHCLCPPFLLCITFLILQETEETGASLWKCNFLALS